MGEGRRGEDFLRIKYLAGKKMSGKFESIRPYDIQDNLFRAIDKEWMLITAGTPDSFNTMTASWGATGILWNKTIAICFVRPQRYTFQFIEKADLYTLSFFGHRYKPILKHCGTTSGRDTDKIRDTGLVPLVSSNGGIYYEQARLVLECEILYKDRLEENNFKVKDVIGKNYPSRDFHTFYIGEIIACYRKP
jgi:flavin reductase (DIM6/NTAB) family NADH-FMN oxidoreductase RutF